MNEPIRAEWASGRRGPLPTSLLLFFFGLAVLLALGIVAIQGGVEGEKGIPLPWAVAGGGWGIGAVLLAFATRREAPRILRITALIWWFPFWLIVIEGGRLGLFNG